MGQFDNSILYITQEMWETFLAKRGKSPEEKGYVFAEKLSGNDLFAIFQIEETTGNTAEVTSLDYMLDAIGEFTEKYPDIHLISYHTHPINTPSGGDLETFKRVYQEKYRNHIIIGPDKVKAIRANADGSITDIYALGLLKIRKLSPSKQKGYIEHGKFLANEFLRAIKRFI